MMTLHTAYRVADLDRSAGFSEKVGFREVGRVARLLAEAPDVRAVAAGATATLTRGALRALAQTPQGGVTVR